MPNPFRVAIGGIEHETSTFTVGATLLEAFARETVRGEALGALGNANTIVDGLVRGTRDEGLEVVPLVWAQATSGAPPSRATFESLASELTATLRRVAPVDGVLLSLHGSFAAEGHDDADGEILARVRAVVGPDCPVIAVHDLHSNLTQRMADAATALIVERTYPHIDMAERGLDAARLLAATLRGDVRPTMAFRSLPLLWSAPKMHHAEPPMSEAITQLHRLDETPGVLAASIGVGYQWIDSPVVGASTVVVTDGAPQQAHELADALGRWIWERRADWIQEPVSPQEALSQAEARGRYPIVLAEQGDNTGGGAPGDGVEILRLFVEHRLAPAAFLYLVDPETANAAHVAGAGASIEATLGGKSHPSLGPPLELTTHVRTVSDGHFTYDGPMWEGVRGHMGPSALLEHNGVSIVVISEREQPIDLAFPRKLGLDCRTMRYICVKSTGHFRSGFGPIAGSIHNVDTATLLSHDFRQLPYRRLGRTMYPLADDATW